jgi:hypothetical protein
MKFDLGAGVKCDLQKLIDTRALIQANSGGGKSHTLRRLLEQTHGKVQQLVIDPEGEFSSLREKGDYILAAKTGGDTAADPRAAKLLAERLLQLGVSAILDIYELKAHERIRFVRAFLEALVDAPKTLWHPALVVVDEAHVFCPQQGEAESAGAVIDLCTRGRKRGFSAILATQRLSKLHKDAAAELNNKLIGRTGLDVDRKRAGEELGFTTKEQLLSLRQLEPGHFYAFGPALSLEVVEVQVGPVQTTHPKAGSRIAFTPPPPTDAVKALLPQLADLPAEVEQKQRTEAELKKDLAAARATITRLERAPRIEPKAETKVERVAVPMLTEEHLAGLKAAAAAIQSAFAGARGVLEQMVQERGALTDALKRIDVAIAQATKPLQTRAIPRGRIAQIEVKVPMRTPAPRFEKIESSYGVDVGAGPLPKGEATVLRAVAGYPEGCGKKELITLTGYTRRTRDSYLQRLSEKGLVQVAGTSVIATAAGIAALGSDFEPLPVGDALLQYWRGQLPEGERRVLEVAVAAYPETIPKPAIDEATGYTRRTRDSYLQRLGAKRLVEADRDGVKASDLLFDGAA